MSRRGGEPVPIGSLIRDVIARRGIGGSVASQTVREAFDKIVDERLAGRVHVVGLQGATVTVATDSDALRFELQGFGGAELLERLRREPGADFVKKVKFVVGAPTND